MKKAGIIAIVALLVIIILVLARVGINGGEDSWIKNEKGIYVKHGKPIEKPDKVNKQEQAVSCALEIYASAKKDRMEFNSQCLGTCGDYAVDIVHVPRTSEDNKIENQCSDYREGKAAYFIELDKEGNIVRISN